MKKSKLSFKKIVVNLIFVLLSFVYLVPFLLVIVNSLKSSPEAQKLNLLLPTKYYFENFITVIREASLGRAALNGLIYSVTAVVVIILFCSFTAYILSRRNDKISKIIHSYFMLGIIIPSALIPTFMIMKILGLLGTYQGLIMIYISCGIPMAIFLYKEFINAIPKELDEAAFVDGASVVRTFYLIIFPTLKPITATVTVLTFMNTWNDFTTQLYFGTIKLRAMPLSVYGFFGKFSQSWNLVFADVLLTMIPVIIVYFVAQKYIISGLTAGAVKS